ncbi:MAG: hypothetical protein FJ125_03665 [Deltaproteobacteria bacterium]|nr:hypothetical protein [Deltaproteobacteria bacterium]
MNSSTNRRMAWIVLGAPPHAVLCAVLLTGQPAVAEEGRQQAQALDFEQSRQQGIQYYKRKLLLPAAKSLEEAAATPRGAKDYKTHSYLAKVYYDLLHLEKAFPTAARAAELVRDEEQKRSAAQFQAALVESFAGVTFQKDPEQKTELKDTYIHLKDVGGLINQKKKEAFQKIQERFLKSRVVLPITLYLPFGKYTANGAPFEIKKGEVAKANLFMYGTAPDGIGWYWFAGGAAVVAAGTAVLMAVLLSGEEEVQQARFEAVKVFPEP